MGFIKMIKESEMRKPYKPFFEDNSIDGLKKLKKFLMGKLSKEFNFSKSYTTRVRGSYDSTAGYECGISITKNIVTIQYFIPRFPKKPEEVQDEIIKDRIDEMTSFLKEKNLPFKIEDKTKIVFNLSDYSDILKG